MTHYGGFWLRVGAYIIDAIILQFVSAIITVVFLGVGAMASGGGDEVAGAAIAITYTLTFAINWLYFALLESSSWQGTVGKKGLNLIVTDERGERIGFGRATGRYFAKFLSALIMLIGFFMVGWTDRKRGLHDMIAGTLVYRANSPDLVRNAARVFE